MAVGTRSVALELPEELYNRAADAAKAERRGIGEMMGMLIEDGLQKRLTAQEKLRQLSLVHRARLKREGKLSQSRDVVIQELRELREQTVREQYP